MSISTATRTLRQRLELIALAGTTILGIFATAAVMVDWASLSPGGAADSPWTRAAAWGQAFAAHWPTIFAFDLGRYVIASTAMAGIVALILGFGNWRKRIQPKPPAAADYRREVAFSVQTALIFSLVGFCVYLGLTDGMFTIEADIASRGYGYMVLSLAGMIVAHDGYFYWTHRAMHHPRLFRFFHLVHHRSTAPTAFAAYAFAWPEALVQALFMPLWLLFVPMQATALLLFMAIMIVRNVMGHAGVELHSRAFVTSRWLWWLSTTTHHDLHHQRFAGNYGLYFTWWDRLMGTEILDYQARFLQATEPARKDA